MQEPPFKELRTTNSYGLSNMGICKPLDSQSCTENLMETTVRVWRYLDIRQHRHDRPTDGS